MLHLLHSLGSYSLLIGFGSQFVVLYGAIRTGEKPAAIQATLLILALGSASLALAIRPPLPPQLGPDLLGCFTGVLLLTPAVEAIRKLRAAKHQDSNRP